MKMVRALTGIVFSCAAFTALAVPPEIAEQAEAATQQFDIDMPGGDQAVFGFAPAPEPLSFRGPNPTEDEVGDADSFGRSVTYLGVKQMQTVSLQSDCTGIPPDAGPCVTLPVDLSQTTVVDESDLAIFELPRRATKSLICFNVTMFSNWNWQNTTGVQEFAVMTVNPSFQIQSDVLNDPALIDPVSGLPFNGELFPAGALSLSTLLEFRSLDAGEFELKAPRLARDCTGGLISKRVLTDTYGLTDRQVRDFFRGPLTISFGVRGNISSVTNASFSYGVRLYGD